MVPGRPTNLDTSRAGAYCAYIRCGSGLFGHFFFRLSFSLLFLPLWYHIDGLDETFKKI